MRRLRHTWSGRLAGLLLLLAATVAVHCLWAVWPAPDGPRGPEALRRTLLVEWNRIAALAPGPAGEAIASVARWTWRIGGEWTGLDFLVRLGAAPALPAGPDEAMRRFVAGTWTFWGALYWSIQLLGLRLGVLLVSMPLVAAAALVAVADGIAAWHVRSSAAGRESGFLYHRAKLGLWASLLALWAAYLLPPVHVDPRIVLPAFVLAFAAALRVAVGWFKKHV